MSSAIVLGGYGTFGAQVACELAAGGIRVTVAGRSLAQAEAAAHALGPDQRGLAVDLTSPASCRAALAGQQVAVNCAGSLANLGPNLLDACLAERCHYADIAVERTHAALVRAADERFRAAGLCAVYGCSSLPAISGALGLLVRGETPAVPWRARVTLFIGNDNPKGRGAIQSLTGILGKPLRAPQGTVSGFRDREVVPLPQPFGRRAVFNFDSPEYDLFPALLGVYSVSVKVGFELRLTTYGFALLAMLGWECGARTLHLMEWVGERLRWVGSSGGAVMTELFYEDGSARRAALVARRHGQRMASLPCALVVRELCGMGRAGGASTAYEFLGAERLLGQLRTYGFRLYRGQSTRANGWA